VNRAEFVGESPLQAVEHARQLYEDMARIADGILPSADRLEEAPLLSDWTFGGRTLVSLRGQVDQHPVLGTRRVILTSPLYVIGETNRVQWARTWSRYYVLSPVGRGDG
jgi:hypothetical protein